jgi:hypothetical protein
MEVLMGKSSINGPFSMAMLNNQRVIIIPLNNPINQSSPTGWSPIVSVQSV